MRWALWATVCSPSHHAIRVLCAVMTRLWRHWWFCCTLFCVRLFALRASSHCKHDVGALSWLNAKTVERVPTLLFDRLVRCSAHGRSFERLWYKLNIRSSVQCWNRDVQFLIHAHSEQHQLLWFGSWRRWCSIGGHWYDFLWIFTTFNTNSTLWKISTHTLCKSAMYTFTLCETHL